MVVTRCLSLYETRRRSQKTSRNVSLRMTTADRTFGPIARHIVLVGLMGTGKSSVGRALAAKLGRVFTDTDRKVESLASRPVREIFETDGEEVFRGLEAKVLQEVLSATEPSIVAAAGGVVTRDENRQLLLERGKTGDVVVVWLRANTQELLERVQKGLHRPLLDADPSGTLTEMERLRTPWYDDVSSFVVDTNGLSIDQVANVIIEQLDQGI